MFLLILNMAAEQTRAGLGLRESESAHSLVNSMMRVGTLGKQSIVSSPHHS